MTGQPREAFARRKPGDQGLSEPEVLDVGHGKGRHLCRKETGLWWGEETWGALRFLAPRGGWPRNSKRVRGGSHAPWAGSQRVPASFEVPSVLDPSISVALTKALSRGWGYSLNLSPLPSLRKGRSNDQAVRGGSPASGLTSVARVGTLQPQERGVVSKNVSDSGAHAAP